MKSIIVYENDDHKYNDHHDKTQNIKSSSKTNVKNKLASLLMLGMMTSPYNYINNKDGEDKE
mgnify:CR=1 FL=1